MPLGTRESSARLAAFGRNRAGPSFSPSAAGRFLGIVLETLPATPRADAFVAASRQSGAFFFCFFRWRLSPESRYAGNVTDNRFMRLALRLARRGYAMTSPNPMVGAVLVKNAEIIGQGWHHRAGEPHAEVEAIRDAGRRGNTTAGATLYVTLEPCSTQGRTPPCTEAIRAADLRRVVASATDPNPKHAGRGFRILRRAGIEVVNGVLAEEAVRLNEAFNHRI